MDHDPTGRLLLMRLECERSKSANARPARQPAGIEETLPQRTGLQLVSSRTCEVIFLVPIMY